MRKIGISLIALILMFPIFVKGIGINGITTGVPYTTASFTKCTDGYFPAGGKSFSYGPTLEGVRITFFNTKGEALGNTVDVWNQKDLYSSYNCTTASASKRFEECTSEKAFVNMTPSRIDYYNGVVKKSEGDYKIVKTNYTYYVDKNYNGKNQYNPLWYSKSDKYKEVDASAIFQNYFTTPSIVKSYMEIAGVDIKKYNPNSSSDYLFIIEPIVYANTCSTEKRIGNVILSIADANYFLRPLKVTNYRLFCDYTQSLRLTSNGKVGNTTFVVEKTAPKKCSGSSDNYAWSDNLGLGMYIVYGEDVCPNCGSVKTYQVVYHTINLNNPFVNENGDKRNLNENSNWYNKETTINTNVYSNSPKYTVVLTPTDIKDIREENKTIDYSKISDDTFKEFKSKYETIFK